MDFIDQFGALALATRLKRLSERLGQDVSRVYRELELDFESKWFLVLALLEKEKELPVVEIANKLKLSHPAIVQFAQQMEEAGLVISYATASDGRKRLLALSDKGRELFDQLRPVLDMIRKANEEWIAESNTDLLSVISQLERSLDRESMYDRIGAKLKA